MLLDYGQFMDKHGEWAPEPGDDSEPRVGVRFRAPKWMNEAVKSLALIETQVLREGGRRGAVSTNKMLLHVLERFLIGYQTEYGQLPSLVGDEDRNKKLVAGYAAGVKARRDSKKK